MHTEARVYVKGDNVFISRGWSNARHQWKEQKRFYHHVTASSLRRLQKLYAVRRYNYGEGHYELYRTAYLRRAA
jgi:hypothetical protein